ncbi:MAG: hypothetical protein WC054_00875 [Candidatus Nanopelagicales bacterium]
MKYAKLVMQVVVTIAAALVAALAGDNVVDSVEWVNVAIIGVGAAAVFTAPNIPGAKYTKFIVSALAAILTVLASAIVGGIQTVELIQMLIAAAGAVGVYAIPNRGQTVSYDDTNIAEV